MTPYQITLAVKAEPPAPADPTRCDGCGAEPPEPLTRAAPQGIAVWMCTDYAGCIRRAVASGRWKRYVPPPGGTR